MIVRGTGIDAQLHAVVTARADAARPTPLAPKGHCARRLPTYMIIDSLSVVEELPRTANGKLDRAELMAAHHTTRI